MASGGVRTDDRDMTPERTRIGLIAPPWLPVPPPHYGGTELVVDLLARGVQAAGVDVVLCATADSTSPVPTISHLARGLGTVAEPAAEEAHAARAYADLAAVGVDLIHDHTTLGPLLHDVHPPGIPVVTTVHGRLDPEATARYREAARWGVHVVAISAAQRRSAPGLPVAAVIHHGIDTGSARLGAGDGGYLLFLGRMGAVKGVHRAIRVARACGRRVLVAAKMWEPDEHEYFATVVRPMLGPDVDLIGPVGGQEKDRVLEGAVALVNAIRWPEPFGLVMVEAMARGTPVLTFAEGAAPEIVDPGITGFVCRDEADLAAHVEAAAALDRAACRARAIQRFDASRMVARHLDLYRHLIRGSRAGPVVDLTERGDPAAGPVGRRTLA